ncbi:MAG: hypothetical protein ABSH17_04810 [Syntrophobacteraceae bacterium]|jgi:hypothetical protein
MGTKAAINLSIILAIVALTVPALWGVVATGETAQQQLGQTVDNTPKFNGGSTGDDSTWRAEPPKAPGYACPPTPYINCMPPVAKSARSWCDPEYLKWAKSHCPGLKILH